MTEKSKIAEAVWSEKKTNTFKNIFKNKMQRKLTSCNEGLPVA